MTRELPHPVESVWAWLTDPDRLRRWSPVVPDRALERVGPADIQEDPDAAVLDGEVLAVDPPRELVHRWGADDVLQWRLTPTAAGCRLMLDHSMPSPEASSRMAAGWHLCLDVLAGTIDAPARRRVAGAAATEIGLDSLRDAYSARLGA
ncbi:SRPBCC domain-containing protein [Mycobacterium sp. MYCO198283]|uniref:SRPBCC domain-containing protein n=1 Tax=Mycobacterium sp. MYCO198283 TaxID=2883505 RepID=UPI0027E18679|nr:SRPBCC domain-containing protein [Mycobacterium sp. MYCO198283]